MVKGFADRDWPEPKPQKDVQGYTKGDWGVEEEELELNLVGRNESYKHITAAPLKHEKRTHSSDVAISIAPNENEQVANAHLIAAAPRMYEALKELIDIVEDLLDSQSPKVYDSLTLQPARIALAKAEGK